METSTVVLLVVLAILLLTVAGFLIWYFFFVLAQHQVFLVSWPYSEIDTHIFSKEEGESLAANFGGTWATQQQLVDAMHNGFFLYKAGYLSDVETPDVGCNTAARKNQPSALFTSPPDSGSTQIHLSNACSQGYFIFGNKTKSAPSGFTVEPWYKSMDGSTVIKNLYAITSWNDFLVRLGLKKDS